MTLTVNSPVSVSYPTCVTWTGFSGADMAGLRGDDRLKKLEKPLFFLSALFSFASSLYLCRAVLSPPMSARAGGMSSIFRPVAARLCDNLTAGLANAGPVPELFDGIGRERKGSALGGEVDEGAGGTWFCAGGGSAE